MLRSFKDFFLLKEDFPYHIFVGKDKGKIKRSIRKTHGKSLGSRKFSLEIELKPDNWVTGPSKDDIEDMFYDDPADYYDEYMNYDDFMYEIELQIKDYKNKSKQYVGDGDFEEVAKSIAFQAMYDYFKDNKKEFDQDMGIETDGFEDLDDRYRDISDFFSIVFAKAYINAKESSLESSKQYVSDKKKALSQIGKTLWGDSEAATAAKKKINDFTFEIENIKRNWFKIGMLEYGDLHKFLPNTKEELDGMLVVDDILFRPYSTKTSDNTNELLADYIKNEDGYEGQDFVKSEFFQDYYPGINPEANEMHHINYEFYVKSLAPAEHRIGRLPDRYYDQEVYNIKASIINGFINNVYADGSDQSSMEDITRSNNSNFYTDIKAYVFDLIDSKADLHKVQIKDSMFVELKSMHDNLKHVNISYRNSVRNLGILSHTIGEGIFKTPRYTLSIVLSEAGPEKDPRVSPFFSIKLEGDKYGKVLKGSNKLGDIIKYINDEYSKIEPVVMPERYKGLSAAEIHDRLNYQVGETITDFWNERIKGLNNYSLWYYGGGREEAIESFVEMVMGQGDYNNNNTDNAVEEASGWGRHALTLDWDVVPDGSGYVEFRTEGKGWSWKEAGDVMDDLVLLSQFETDSNASAHVHLDNTLEGDLFGEFALVMLFDEKTFKNDPSVIGDGRDKEAWANEIKKNVIASTVYYARREEYTSFWASEVFHKIIGSSKAYGINVHDHIHTLEFRYPSAVLLDDPGQILANVQYFSTVMSLASKRNVVRLHTGTGEYIIAVRHPTKNDFLIQVLDGDKFDRKDLTPEMKEMLRKYGH